jgi:hypothetical protein
VVNPTLQIEEIEASQFGAREARHVGDGLRVDRALPGRPPQGVFKFLHQRSARIRP